MSVKKTMLTVLPLLFLACESRDLSSASTPNSRNVSFVNVDVRLAGTLHLPSTPGPHPAIVTVHGSGRQTRWNHKHIADYFVQRGVAVLSYDKRGVGESEGEYTGIGPANSVAAFEDLSGDALAGVRLLKNRNDINPDQIGLLGVSQAGWIIPLAAAKSKDVAFIVLLSGPTVSVGAEIYYSDLTGDVRETNDISVEAASSKTRDFIGQHGFDPVPSLESLSIPGLWLLGSKDRSIPVSMCVEILRGLINDHGKDFHIINYPNANHGLRDAMTGTRMSALSDAFEWVAERVDLGR